jgi:hypothetical protein
MRDPDRNTVRSLEKRSIDSLIQQLFDQIGGVNRIVGPNEAFTPLDERYVGVLTFLLKEFIPGIPDVLLSTVKQDLIVVSRVTENPSELVTFGQSTLRVAKPYSAGIDSLKETYESLLNMTIIPTSYLDTDLANPHIVFHENFFTPRSIKGWCRLSLYFSRLCQSMFDLATQSGLKHGSVFHSDRETFLLYSQFVDAHAQEMELITPS